jgi:hypothetical protein
MWTRNIGESMTGEKRPLGVWVIVCTYAFGLIFGLLFDLPHTFSIEVVLMLVGWALSATSCMLLYLLKRQAAYLMVVGLIYHIANWVPDFFNGRLLQASQADVGTSLLALVLNCVCTWYVWGLLKRDVLK